MLYNFCLYKGLTGLRQYNFEHFEKQTYKYWFHYLYKTFYIALDIIKKQLDIDFKKVQVTSQVKMYC